MLKKIDFKPFEGKIDLLIGGSPCTNLSICGNRKGLDGDESRLFWEFVRAIKECKPKYFFLENVASMSDKDKEIISQELGCYPIMINSSLVSAQNRRRYYWFNWGDKQYNLFGMPTCDIPQPKDKKIVLKDVLENGYGINCLKYGKTLTKAVNKSVALCARDYKGFKKLQESTGVLEPLTPYVEKQYKKYQIKNGEIPEMFNPYNCQKIEDKSPTLTTSLNSQSSSSTVMLFEPCIYQLPHGYNKGAIIKDKAPTMTVSAWEHNNKVCEPVQIGNIGSNAQAHRVYSIRGKSVTLNANGGGQGGKTGLYKIDLPDGDYIIRKLTPLECERLQTLNDNYTEGISNSQRYKCIGNGWTVDVIAYIFSYLKNDLTSNKHQCSIKKIGKNYDVDNM